MANRQHLKLLRRGVRDWNRWRAGTQERPNLRRASLRGARLKEVNLSDADLSGCNISEAWLPRADLSRANLSGAQLGGADLSYAKLIGASFNDANLTEAVLIGADLTGATLAAMLYKAKMSLTNVTGADVVGAYLYEADLSGANLSGADLSSTQITKADLSFANLAGARLVRAEMNQVNLTHANLCDADLRSAHLSGALMIGTLLENANLSDANVYGAAVWDVKVDGAKQENLSIAGNRADANITVDNLEVAQFIHLLIHNQNIRAIIDTITSKVVLLLGRFTPERKVVLDALRAALRARGYSPVLFDSEKPRSRDLTETISTLAGMARFVIADITDAKSVPQELKMIVPHYPSDQFNRLLLHRSRRTGCLSTFGDSPGCCRSFCMTHKNNCWQGSRLRSSHLPRPKHWRSRAMVAEAD